MVLAQYLYDKLVVPQRERMRDEAAARKARMEAARKEDMEAGREEVIRALHRDWRRRRREALLQGEPFNEPSPIDRLRESDE